MKKILLAMAILMVVFFGFGCWPSTEDTKGTTGSQNYCENGNGTNGTGTIVEPPEPPFRADNSRRGVGYSFASGGATDHTEQDMDLLMGGAHGISWFYSWGIAPNQFVEMAAAQRELDFMPMAWRYLTDAGEERLRELVAANPNIRYLRAINEPNLTDQGNRTPEEFATHPNGWRRIRAVAQELGLKIIAPALNFGTLPGYGNPNVWLEEFFEHPYVDINDFHALSLNVYMSWPGSFKGFVERFYRYDLPIWISEFCAWYTSSHGVARPFMDWEWQSFFMSQSVAFLEQNPRIERYAWFIPKSSREFPQNYLLTNDDPPELTQIGKIYRSMSVFDPDLVFEAGVPFAASQMNRNNIADHMDTVIRFPNDNITSSPITPPNHWGNSVNFMPNTDEEYLDICELEIRDFTNGMWIEYEIEIEEVGEFVLDKRARRHLGRRLQDPLAQTGGITTAARLELMLWDIEQGEGELLAEFTVEDEQWSTNSIELGELPAGRHTLRIVSRGGNVALNWLKIHSPDLYHV